LVIPFFNSPGVSPNWADVATDSRFFLKAIDPGLYVHEGFLSAYASIEKKLDAALNEALSSGKPIWLCGHSLGAALATIAAYKHRGRVQGLYTFGSPRVGNGSFAITLKEGLQNIYRFVHHRDAVPTMPPEGLPLTSHTSGWRKISEAIRDLHSTGYTHVGQLKYITGQDSWHIHDDGGPFNTLRDLTKDAIAYTKEVADTIARRFSIRHPASWPILLRAIADHSPLYYTNKIFNAHEEHATSGERSTEERS
jgi:pimeloyl-ACP methyl ester carboxylesterase